VFQNCKAKRGRKKNDKIDLGFSEAIASHCRKQPFWKSKNFEPCPHPSMFAFVCKAANAWITVK
jgi:hypothetical protein